MSTTTREQKPWDFTQVYSLLDSLKNVPAATVVPSQGPVYRQETTPRNASKLPPLQTKLDEDRDDDDDDDDDDDTADSGVALGNLNKVWQFLGVPSDLPPVQSQLLDNGSPTLQEQIPDKEDYISDGALYAPTSVRAKSKNIQWRDEANGEDLTDVAPVTSEDNAPKLTKSQRKKNNRKERKRLEEEARRIVSDYEDEVEEVRDTPARKASVHNLSALAEPGTTSMNRHKFRARSTSVTPLTAKPAVTKGNGQQSPSKNTSQDGVTDKKIRPATGTPKVQSLDAKETSQSSADSIVERIRQSGAAHLKKELPVTPRPKTVTETSRQQSEPSSVPTAASQLNNSLKQQWPVQPYSAHASSFQPSTVQSSKQLQERHISLNHIPNVPTEEAMLETQETPSRSKPRRNNVIEPKTVRSGEDRNWALLLKLIADFYEDRKHLVRPANLSNHSNDPKGIHVFVDASNIFIGFHDQLKRSRGIPQHWYVPRVNMSFDALALLMERRRPVAKRVLAGSTPEVPAFATARDVGYECSILDKVFKARELTERQKYFMEVDQRRRSFNGRRPSGGRQSSGYASGGSSKEDPETAVTDASAAVATATTPTHAPEKFVEQAVDEILHLKILESVVDYEEPSTIVLATGDAAQAEYSQGFMRMVERALKKGWTVELVSWSKNISMMYKKKEFRQKWGDKFRIIELDDYAEELLDM
ncbi:hypothetical protein H2203_004035 [Taxawa tesnikishii (nom. ined.)]|nr:hypothetical protein H2203_004035 [Dothideales sp. JES 119]